MAYNLLDLQSAIQDDLKDPNFNASRLTRYINYAQLWIFNTHSFRFCQKAVSGALTIGSFQYNQQTDHQSTIGGVLIDVTNPKRVFELNKDTYRPHREFFESFPDPSSNTAAMPSAWTEYSGQLYFNCPVDKAYTFNQRYYRVPVTLAAATDVPTVPESFRELLELYAEFRAEGYRGNRDVSVMIEGQMNNMLESMVLRYSPATMVANPRMRGATVRVDRLF